MLAKSASSAAGNVLTVQLLQAHHAFGETVCFAGAAFSQCKEVHIILAFFVKDLVGNAADAVFREGDKMLRCRCCTILHSGFPRS